MSFLRPPVIPNEARNLLKGIVLLRGFLASFGMTLRVAFAMTCVVLLASCDNTPTEPQPIGNFPGKVAVIIHSNCLGGSCHSTATKVNKGLDLSTWENAMKGDDNANDIIPFDAKNSFLFQHINTNTNLGTRASPRMPLARNPLSSEDQRTIYDWINEGAKSADGKVAYDDKQDRIFVTSQGGDRVVVLDADTRRIIRTITFPDGSQPTAIARTGESIIVGLTNSSTTIYKYNIHTLALEGTFASGVRPQFISISPDGKKGYIAVEGSAFVNRIGVFDPVGMTMTKVITTPYIISSSSVIFTRDGSYAYICGKESDNILKLDTKNDSIVANITFSADIPVPPDAGYLGSYDPVAMALSNDEKTLYVTSLVTKRVFVFDLTSNASPTEIKVGVFARDIRLLPNTDELWVVNSGSNTIFIIDISSGSVTETIDSVGSEPFMVSFTPDGSTAFVACHFQPGTGHHSQDGPPPSSVIVIDVATRKKIKTIEMPTYSAGIVVGY